MRITFTILQQYQPKDETRGNQKTETHGVEYDLQAIQIGEITGNCGGRGPDPE